VAKTHILCAVARSVERIGGFGGKSDLLALPDFTGHPDCYKDYLRRIKQATPASVRKSRHDWLSDGITYSTWNISKRSMGRTRNWTDQGAGPAVQCPVPAADARATLSNGLKVVLAERTRGTSRQFNLLNWDSGFAADPANAPGTAQLLASHAA